MYIAYYSRSINRNVDTCIKFIAQDTFLESHASVCDQGQTFESQTNLKSLPGPGWLNELGSCIT